jgi:hypothetical protein
MIVSEANYRKSKKTLHLILVVHKIILMWMYSLCIERVVQRVKTIRMRRHKKSLERISVYLIIDLSLTCYGRKVTFTMPEE